jgi:hypothetical protein
MRWFLGIGMAIVLIVLAIFYFISAPETSPNAHRGNITIIEWGRTSNYGYVVVKATNGSADVMLCALSQQPKKRIVVFKQDYFNTNTYSKMIKKLKPFANNLGLVVLEMSSTKDIARVQDSFVLIPSGAMPYELLNILKNMTNTNIILYIGKDNLIYNKTTKIYPWLEKLDGKTKKNIVLLPSSLPEFLDSDSAWNKLRQVLIFHIPIKTSCSPCLIKENITTTCSVELRGGKYLLLIHGNQTFSSNALPSNRGVTYGKEKVFPWNKVSIMLSVNQSHGSIQYYVKKNGEVLKRKFLSIAEQGQVFYFVEEFNESGDYICYLEDKEGYIIGKKIHVYDVSVELEKAFGSLFKFKLLIDNKPPAMEKVKVYTNQSNATIDVEVINGMFEVRGDAEKNDVFHIIFKGKTFNIEYKAKGGSFIFNYLRFLGIAVIVWIAIFVIIRFIKKPTYRLLIPEEISFSTKDIRIKKMDILSVFKEVNKRYGWSKVPLTTEEVMLGIKKKLAKPIVLFEGNIEEILLSLEKEGLVEGYDGFWQPKNEGWGDIRKNVLKRKIRDLLVSKGIAFDEKSDGFVARDEAFFVEPKPCPKKHIFLVVSDELEKEMFLKQHPERAKVEIMIKNGRLTLITLNELKEMFR